MAIRPSAAIKLLYQVYRKRKHRCDQEGQSTVLHAYYDHILVSLYIVNVRIILMVSQVYINNIIIYIDVNRSVGYHVFQEI